MGARIAVAVVGGALLFAAALLLVPRPPSSGGTPPPAPSRAAITIAAADAAPPVAPPDPVPTAAPERALDATASTPRHARRLRVVDEAGGPVPGAAVTWRPSRAFEGDSPLLTLREPFPTRTWTTPARADDEGIVTVGHRHRLVEVEAFDDGRHGRIELDLEGAGTAELTVDADAALALRAVDRSGAPVADVPFVVRASLTKAPLWRGRTRADGVVVCPHAGRLPSCEVVPDLPFDRLEPQPITAEDVARGTLTTRLPPGAPLEVVLHRPDGTPYEDPALVWALDRDGDPFWAIPPADGRWRRPWFPLGRKLRIDAVPIGRCYRPVSVEAIGPVRTGKAVEVSVRFAHDDRPPHAEDELTATLVRPDGAPAAGRAVEWTLDEEDRDRPGTAATDAEGRFRLRYESFLPPTVPVSISLLLTDPDLGSLHAVVDLTGRLLPGGVRLGEVALAPTRLAAAGVVDEPDGRPVAGATVVLRTADGAVLAEVVTGDDGRFALRHPGAPDDLRVQARSGRHLHAPPRACRAGTERLRLTLNPAGGVAGRVLLDAAVDPTGVELLVGQGRRQRTVAVGDDGRFEAWGFATGTCTVRVRLAGQVETLERIARIPVRCGERTVDPRLDPIDLRARIRPVTVTVVDEGGAAVRARIRVDGQSRAESCLTDERGRAVVLASSLPLRVEVSEVPDPSDGPALRRRGPRARMVELSDDLVVVLDD